MSLNDAIDEYYKLKKRYFSKYNNAKHRIIMGDDSIKEKQKKVKKIQLMCVNCKRKVGTIFQETNRELMAVCGDKTNPCNLNIKIKKGKYETVDYLDDFVNTDSEIVKVKIIETKLLLLFNLANEDEIQDNYENLKDMFKSILLVKSMVSERKNNNNSSKVDTIGGEKIVDNDIIAETNKIKLDNLISSFKQLISDYKDEDKKLNKAGIMNDAIDMYINQIIPTEKNIRDALYKVTNVTEEKDLYVVNKINTILDDTIIELEEGEVISNKK